MQCFESVQARRQAADLAGWQAKGQVLQVPRLRVTNQMTIARVGGAGAALSWDFGQLMF